MKALFAVACMFLACQSFAQEPATPEIIRQADQYISDYNFGKALEVLGAPTDSLDVGFLRRIGYCRAKLGNYADAIEVYQQIRSIDSLNRESLLGLGQLYAQTDQYDLSKDCFGKLIDLDSTNSYYFKQYAALAARTNDPISAIVYYMQTIRINPKDMEAFSHLSTLLLEAEQYAQVDSMLTGVLATSENNELRLLLARAKLGQDKYDEVIREVGKILETNDTTATYARLLGISYFLSDRYEQVIPCMKFLTGMGAKADWIYYYLGVAYQKTGAPENAIEYLNLAVEESISDHIGAYYTQLASAYEEVRDYRNAIRTYKVAYERSRADILLYHLARNYDVYYKDKTQAQVYYQKYLESDDTVTLAKAWSKQRLDMLSSPR